MQESFKQSPDALICAARNGDVSAFARLVENHQSALRAFVAARTPHTRDVDDMAQETFVLAWAKLSELNKTSSFFSWLCGIALNLLRNHHRKLARMELSCPSHLELMLDANCLDTETMDESLFSTTVLKACLLKLSQDAQELIRMHYMQELSVKELTQKLDLKHSTITMRLHRARQWLKECVSKGEANE